MPRKIIGLFLLVYMLPLVPAWCSAQADRQPEPKSQRAEVPAKTGASTQPLYASPTTRDRVGRIVVPVMLNDQGPFRFVLDTGANRSALAAHMMEKLGLMLSDETMSVELSGVTGQAIVRTATVKRLQAGALLLKNLSMPVIDATVAGVDGVLGVEGLQDMRLTIDFANDKVLIERSHGQRTAPEFVILPVYFRHGRLLMVDAVVGRVKTKAVIDTGADGTLGTERLRQLLLKQFAEDRLSSSTRIEGATAQVQEGELLAAPPIRFEGLKIDDARIAYGNFHVFDLWDLQKAPALLVGMDVLGTVDTLIIDYRLRELKIKPRPSQTF
jgi:predicted aspartyl protease